MKLAVVVIPSASPPRPCLAMRVAVHRRGRAGGGAGDVEQDRRVGAAIDRADIGADQRDQGLLQRELVAEEAGQDGDGQRRGQPGQRAEDDAEEDRGDQVDIGDRVGGQRRQRAEKARDLCEEELHVSPPRAA
jgi:hypothetical protein